MKRRRRGYLERQRRQGPQEGGVPLRAAVRARHHYGGEDRFGGGLGGHSSDQSGSDGPLEQPITTSPERDPTSESQGDAGENDDENDDADAPSAWHVDMPAQGEPDPPDPADQQDPSQPAEDKKHSPLPPLPPDASDAPRSDAKHSGEAKATPIPLSRDDDDNDPITIQRWGPVSDADNLPTFSQMVPNPNDPDKGFLDRFNTIVASWNFVDPLVVCTALREFFRTHSKYRRKQEPTLRAIRHYLEERHAHKSVNILQGNILAAGRMMKKIEKSGVLLKWSDTRQEDVNTSAIRHWIHLGKTQVSWVTELERQRMQGGGS